MKLQIRPWLAIIAFLIFSVFWQLVQVKEQLIELNSWKRNKQQRIQTSPTGENRTPFTHRVPAEALVTPSSPPTSLVLNAL